MRRRRRPFVGRRPVPWADWLDWHSGARGQGFIRAGWLGRLAIQTPGKVGWRSQVTGRQKWWYSYTDHRDTLGYMARIADKLKGRKLGMLLEDIQKPASHFWKKTSDETYSVLMLRATCQYIIFDTGMPCAGLSSTISRKCINPLYPFYSKRKSRGTLIKVANAD